jgi:thiosulfate/3-mercaptopyruvate sulfurtransferase
MHSGARLERLRRRSSGNRCSKGSETGCERERRRFPANQLARLPLSTIIVVIQQHDAGHTRNRRHLMNTQGTAWMAVRRAAGLTAALVLAALPATAQNAVPLLVDVDWLTHHVNDRELVLLHVGSQADYDAGHLQGARRISEEDVSRPHDMTKMATELMLELPPIEELRGKIASYGISDNSRIVVYFGRTTAVQSATRIVFTLDYLGLGDRTSLLNGGLGAWSRAGQATVTQVPSVSRGILTPRPPGNVVADSGLVKSLAGRPRYRLVDARAAVFYRGIEPTMNGAQGHIPGAISIPFSEVTDDKQLIDHDRVAALFQTAGVKADDTVVVYCHVGQQATAVVFAARLLGHPALLYDGSFQDWAINVHGPVEK